MNGGRVKLSHWSACHKATSVHDCEEIDVLADEIHILFDEKNGHSLFVDKIPNHFSNHGNDVGLNAFGGLVQDEKVWTLSLIHI